MILSLPCPAITLYSLPSSKAQCFTRRGTAANGFGIPWIPAPNYSDGYCAGSGSKWTIAIRGWTFGRKGYMTGKQFLIACSNLKDISIFEVHFLTSSSIIPFIRKEFNKTLLICLFLIVCVLCHTLEKMIPYFTLKTLLWNKSNALVNAIYYSITIYTRILSTQNTWNVCFIMHS